MKKIISAFLLLSSSLYGQVTINEVLINPPGTDDLIEFFELKGTPGTSLNGYWLIAIEGDGTTAGTVDIAIDLSGQSIGTNGLFLRRSSNSLLPAPDPGTNVQTSNFTDFENGTTTFLLVRDFTGTVATDYDVNNDGLLDTTPWTSTSDGIGTKENDTGINLNYAGSLGFTDFPANTGFNPDFITRLPSGTWVAGEITTTSLNAGPHTIDNTQVMLTNGSAYAATGTNQLTPGTINTPLPVGWAYFRGEAFAEGVHLSWETISETNNLHFEVQRSFNALTFETVGKLAGQGTTDQATKYQFDDPIATSEIVYYRLKQVDVSGVFSYSRTISVQTETVKQAFPNPVSELLHWPNEYELLRLYDANGVSVAEGQATLQVGHLPVGTYYLKTDSNTKKISIIR